MKAGSTPMLGRLSMASAGTMIASSARLGTVWMMPATPRMGCSSQRTRVASRPSGTLTAVLAASAARVSCRCAVK